MNFFFVVRKKKKFSIRNRVTYLSTTHFESNSKSIDSSLRSCILSLVFACLDYGKARGNGLKKGHPNSTRIRTEMDEEVVERTPTPR